MTDCDKIPTLAEVEATKIAMDDINSFTYLPGDTFVDGEGVTRDTVNGRLKKMGYQVAIPYVGGIGFSVSDNTKTVDSGGVIYAPLPSALPFITDGVFSNDSSKFFNVQLELSGNDGASSVGTTSGSTVQDELDSLNAGQTGGVITFITRALLDAFTPSGSIEENTSYKVTNDSTSDNNGYYHWNGLDFIKDADLVQNVIDKINTSEGVSGKAVFDHVQFEDANGNQIFNSYTDEPFENQFFVKDGGSGGVTYETVNGVPSVRITDCIGVYFFAVDPTLYDNTKPWGFACNVEEVVGSVRTIAQTTTSLGAGVVGDRYDEQTTITGVISGDGFLGTVTSNYWYLYFDATGGEIVVNNVFVGNCVNARYVPFDKKAEDILALEVTADAFNRSQLKNTIPNNLYHDGIAGWDDIPAGANSTDLTQTLEEGNTPLNNAFIRGVGGNALDSLNFMGTAIALDTTYMDVGDVLVFNGLIRKSLGTLNPFIEMRTKDLSFNTLTTETFAVFGENTTDWIDSGELKITIGINTAWIFVFIREFDIGEHMDIVGWSFTKDILPSKFYFPTRAEDAETPPLVTAFYVDTATGSDSNDGTIGLPFLTISKAMVESRTSLSSRIVVNEGTYRETISFLSREGGSKVSIVNALAEKVIISGADALSSFSKTGGFTSIYQAAYAGSIIDYPHTKGKMIFEDGRSDKLIVDFNALQRGLTHRMPYTEITEEIFDTSLAVTLANLDANPGRFHLDAGILYLHATDSDDPSLNGYVYEISTRATTAGTTNRINVDLSGISFRYSSGEGLSLGKINLLTRYNCSVFGAAGDGFNDDANKLISYKDEAAGCGDDGINGHFSAVSGYLLTDQRVGSNQAFVFEAWCHDNADDGLSFHERGECNIYGGLFEFNGDRGIAPASGCNATAYNSTFRNNGVLFGIDGGAGGEGVCVINASIDGRNGTNCTLISCISEENQVGYRATSEAKNRITLISSISRNNIDAELKADNGTIISKNTLATNGTPSKLKVVSGTGSIAIENDPLLT